MSKEFNVAVVGATGLVGRQLLEILEEREFPVGEARFLASDKSEGEFLDFRGDALLVQCLDEEAFTGINLVFFCAPAAVSARFGPVAARAGAVCIDLTDAWRHDADVPLLLPEVNPQEIAQARGKKIIAIPGAAAVALALVLKPLHDLSPLRRLVVTSLQAVSGSGQSGMDELRVQCGELLNGRPCEAKVFPRQIAFNCLPQTGSFAADGVDNEEAAMIADLRRLFDFPELKISVTTVRMPVFYGHSAAVNVEAQGALDPNQARAALTVAPGVELVDDPTAGDYPTPLDAAGRDEVQVGRLRADASRAGGLDLWLAADNLRTGAALPAVRLAELLLLGSEE
ncbi:aspartate-semialdehyde dehydrogenase [Trichloromonas sp.]|uniref:aspartate-semialdehyde dehydrogenase n=1 Tax=Trichloromonas sp. TaxID=3069249 RepID=UPI002A432584|nr:aspartate-semialdehyde dehydrogenase [Trichloromonas sp.]